MFSEELGREVKKETMNSAEYNKKGKPLSFPVLKQTKPETQLHVTLAKLLELIVFLWTKCKVA